ncbi:MAG: PIN domain-containing protein [Luteitalea sp.]|nr:PIN domain-containing protein [Luteitalea sp.]
MVIVDTTVWVDYLKGLPTPEADWLDRELTRQRLGLTDLILCEVLQGLTSEAKAADVLRELQHYEVFDTGGVDLATAAARNYRLVRARGVTVRKTIDCLIATFCLLGDHALLHHDRDFDPFEKELGLQVVHPETLLTDRLPDEEPPDEQARD